jgi:hypothetical protein
LGDPVGSRRGKEVRNIAKVAAARRLLTLVFYGMRDSQIRCLSRPPPRRREPREHPHGTGARSPGILPPAGREAAN